MSESPPFSKSPSSPLSPLSQTDGSRAGYFSPISSSIRLDTITEHRPLNIQQEQRPELDRASSLSGITFRTSPTKPTESWAVPRLLDRGRSPPPASRFQHHVSFDNFSGGDPTEKNTISFTLNVKHIGYQYKRRSRTFMVGIDDNVYSDYAVQWLLEELVDDGDEIVCLRVVDRDAKISSDKSLEKKQYQEEARQLMKAIQKKNDAHRAISIVLEFAVGKVSTTFQKMIQLYQPAMLIVGTRGRSLGGFQGLVSNRNSFSKWCLQYSLVPVVVVRPTEKRDKKKLKRAMDPTRQNYLQILYESGSGTHEANATTPGGSIMETNVSLEKEAHEVAAALGLPAKFDPTLNAVESESNHPLRKIQSAKSDATSRESRSPDSRPTSPRIEMHEDEGDDVDDVDDKSDEEGGEDSEDSEGEFEAVPGHLLLKDEPEAIQRQQKLHQMEVGEAAALAMGRKGSIGSDDSDPPALGGVDSNLNGNENGNEHGNGNENENGHDNIEEGEET